MLDKVSDKTNLEVNSLEGLSLNAMHQCSLAQPV